MSEGDYEHPLSPPAEAEASRALFKPSLTPEPYNMASLPTPSTVTSTSPDQRHSTTSYRRDRSPPRDPSGAFVCDHQDCHGDPPTFRRRCEWNKHLDRHERPYKCHEPGCEVTTGFTYSGGLLRHQREVHKKLLTGKALLYCPYPNCSRSTGDGFTRKENLEEHKRRRHQEVASQSVNPNTLVVANGQPQPQVNGLDSRKRKRPITPPHPEGVDHQGDDDGGNQNYNENQVDPIYNHPVVKRLRAELTERDRIIDEKDRIINHQVLENASLRNFFKSIPNQTFYGVTQNPMSPPASVQIHGRPMV